MDVNGAGQDYCQNNVFTNKYNSSKSREMADGGENISRKSLENCVEKQYIIVFFTTLLWGIVAHGYMFFNKFSWHDDLNGITEKGATYISGRWFAEILGECIQKYLGNVSLPWFNGLFSLLFLAAGNVFLVKLFRLKSTASGILLAGLMTVFPSWVSTYGYMYKAVYYAVAVFLAVLGIYVVRIDKMMWRGILGGGISICLSLGIYQAYLPLAVTVLLINFIGDVIAELECSLKEHLKRGISEVAAVLLGIILYFAGNQIFLAIKHATLTDYQNINQMGHTNLKMMVAGTVSAWREFLMPPHGGGMDMYMQSVRVAYYAVLILTTGLLLWHVVQGWKKNRGSVLILLGSALCFPIGVNLLYLMGNIPSIHGIMVYAKVMVFILPLVLAEQIEKKSWNAGKCCRRILSILLAYVVVFYVHFANVCYLQAGFNQQEVISWMNVLVARIQSEAGYSRDLRIVYLNGEKSDLGETVTLTQLSGVEIIPYGNNFSNWKTGLFRWCGFRHQEITDASEIAAIQSLPEVQEMPDYPADGSVRIIDGKIVVKFPSV